VTVVSVDLAYKRFADIGFCVLTDRDTVIETRFPDVASIADGTPTADGVADRCLDLCEQVGARFLLLDGPQGWKDPENGLPVSRICERALNTPAKSGLPGKVKPGNYLPFVQFSIEVFDALAARGWHRLQSGEPPQGARQIAIESFPLSAWLSLELPALPAKAKCRPEHLDDRLSHLRRLFPLDLDRAPNHDELQALVSGLGGIALEGGRRSGYSVAGVPPVLRDGHWREGLILNPLRSHSGPIDKSQR